MICKYCSKQFNNVRGLNAHIGWCDKNPNIKGPRKSNLVEYNKQRQLVKRPCLYCGNLFSANSMRKYCSHVCSTDKKNSELFAKIEEGDTTISARTCKRYLIYKYGNKCMECGWDKIHPATRNCPVELEHMDGNSNNNELSNLKLLCPNCHSLTPTYKALNKGKGRHVRRERYKDGKSF